VLSNYDLAEYRRAAAALGAEYFLDKLREFDCLPRILRQLCTDGPIAAGNTTGEAGYLSRQP
jgi:hypothetical protein